MERLLLIALGVWVAASLLILPFARRLVMLPRHVGPPDQKALGRTWQPMPASALPADARAVNGPLHRRLAAAGAFAFALLFKLSTGRMRLVTKTEHPLPEALVIATFTLWLVGAGLLALAALTLANLSPPLRALLPAG